MKVVSSRLLRIEFQNSKMNYIENQSHGSDKEKIFGKSSCANLYRRKIQGRIQQFQLSGHGTKMVELDICIAQAKKFSTI